MVTSNLRGPGKGSGVMGAGGGGGAFIGYFNYTS